ncbi:MAG: ABC transporter substrate-binding protein [Armatimonadota bacterium]|nr:ABC transporter substrate-binding protein [Armatimonadota bacterium]
MRVRRGMAVLLGLALVAGVLSPAAGGPAAGGGVVFPIVGDPIFNPWHPRAFIESIPPNRVLFNGLTKIGKDRQPAPDLAERWEISPDGLVWTFHLRRGVKWHDGRDFTADDVKFTYDIVTNPRMGAQNAGAFRALKEVRVVDASTVQLVLETPVASLGALVATNAGIIPRHAFAGVSDPWTHDAFNKRAPVGTGAFKIRQYVAGSFVVLERNPAYFAGAPTIETVTFKVLPDVNAQVAQLLAGDLTLIFIDNPALVRAVQRNPHVEISTVPEATFYWVAPHFGNRLFQDRRVRQAIMHSWDRPAMIRGFLEGFATPASGPISPALGAYYNPNVKTYEFDRAKARALLAEAGWQPGPDGVLVKDGQRFRVTLTYPTVQYFEPLAALIQQYLRAVGIEVALDGLEFNQFIAQRFLPKRYELIAGWWRYPPDPDMFPYLHSSNAERGFNVPVYRNAEVDRWLEEGRKATTARDRQRAYARFQELVAEDLPYLYLWWPNEIRAISKRLKGVPSIGLRDGFQYMHEWRLE